MSASPDVVVVGGGVIGLSCAWRLAQEGLAVTLLERGFCGREASWSAVGVLSPGNPNFKHALARLHLESLDLYPAFCDELRALTGIDPEYARCRRLELCDVDQRYRMGLSEVRATADRAMPDGAPVLEMLTPDDATALEPAMQRPRYGALLCRISAQVRNPRLLQALRRACEQAGVVVCEQPPVIGLHTDGATVTGVLTADQPISARYVVVAAGTWAGSVDPRVATRMPVHPVRGQVLLLEMDDPPFRHIIRRKNHYVLRRHDGLVLGGSTVEHDAGFEIRNTAAGVEGLIQGALSLVPALADARVGGMWSGLRPCTPDWRPYIGFVPGMDGLIAAFGHFKTGLVFAPITARIVADLIMRGQTPFDLSRAAPGRPMKLPRRRD